MLAHVHIMKTAGQTICDILRRSLGGRHCDLRCGDLATLSDIQFAPHVLSESAEHRGAFDSPLERIGKISGPAPLYVSARSGGPLPIALLF